MNCYDAGRVAFWLHRYLVEQGIENLVVDSSSIQVNRRPRQAVSDRTELEKLVGQLIMYRGEEREVWNVVRVPSAGAEGSRQVHRELETLQKDRTRHINRIKSFLVGQGVRIKVGSSLLEEIERVRKWEGTVLPAGLKAGLQREHQRLHLLQEQVKELERDQVETIRHAQDESVEVVCKLMWLNGIGQYAGCLLGIKFFSWREFNHRKEVGALAGLVPMPRQCGDRFRGQGISKAGNRHIRGGAIEVVKEWLQFQPESEPTKWYKETFGQGNKRIRQIGIVVLARKLMIELSRHLETGAIPEGAVLKTRLI